jgi:adenosylmethionine---8-amino-7-oxononanoate aminotransferase
METNKNYRQTDRNYIWHPYSKRSAIENEDFPIISKGEGVYLFDNEGRKYTDAISSWWACSLGHSNPRLIQAMCNQANMLQHSILANLSQERAIELSEMIVHLFADTSRRVFYSSDGASAVEAAMKIAVQYWYNIGQPDKNKFVSLKNDYHGDTLGAVSIGYVKRFHKPFKNVLFPVYQAESPCCGVCEYGPPDSCNLECFESMENIIANHYSEIAAVIVEPLCQAAGGMRIYSAKYLAKLYKLCREKNILLISDEIAMGFGRTGKMFAFEHADIDPDIVCIGKALSSGYLPISAAVIKEYIYSTFTDQPVDNTFYHGHTFAGNPIAAAVAIEVLKIYQEENVLSTVQHLSKKIANWFSRFSAIPFIKNSRWLGILGVIEIDKSDYLQSAALADQIRRSLMKKGILLRPLGTVVYIMPPLIISEEMLENLLQQLYNTLQELV